MEPTKELQFTLTFDEANIVLTGLGELPAKTSLAVINKLQRQAAAQLTNPGPSPADVANHAADEAALDVVPE